MWPLKLRGKHYLPTRGFSKSPFPPRRRAAMTCLVWFRGDLRLHDHQALSRASEAAAQGRCHRQGNPGLPGHHRDFLARLHLGGTLGGHQWPRPAL
ncbi:deoxyribodipyrimidine photo-lyase [Corynebacterium marquesiae]